MQIGHEDEGLHLVLQPGELHQGAEIIAEMQVARGLDARKDAGVSGSGHGSGFTKRDRKAHAP